MAGNIGNLNAVDFSEVSGAVYGNRYVGGSDLADAMHPFIKGYFYVVFEFPENMFGGVSETRTKLANLLLSSAESYTPPGDRQLKTEDIQGLGGLDASFITGQQIDRNFSIQYREYWDAPIFKIHREWTSIISPFSGNTIKTDDTAGLVNAYKGKVWVIQTKPVLGTTEHKFEASDIIKVDIMDGVFPKVDLKSAYDANITDNSIIRPNVQYSYDGYPLDETIPGIKKLAAGQLNKLLMGEQSMHSYDVFTRFATTTTADA